MNPQNPNETTTPPSPNSAQTAPSPWPEGCDTAEQKLDLLANALNKLLEWQNMTHRALSALRPTRVELRINGVFRPVTIMAINDQPPTDVVPKPSPIVAP